MWVDPCVDVCTGPGPQLIEESNPAALRENVAAGLHEAEFVSDNDEAGYNPALSPCRSAGTKRPSLRSSSPSNQISPPPYSGV